MQLSSMQVTLHPGPSWSQQGCLHWVVHSTVVAHSLCNMVFAVVLATQLPFITAGYSFNKCFFCLSSYLQPRTHGQGGKILTTFGFQKCYRMTKIKHQRKPNQKSDSLENETEQGFTLQRWYSMSLPSSFFFFYLNLYVAFSFLKTDAFSLCLTQWRALQPENIDFLCFVLLTASSALKFLS